ncbi:MAG TPA: PH domain-containing protein [Mycobacteriales bacterium]|jgi:hypothetical protein|nr:PH domain-containing protein [Mycobacteriales bacterium]
MSEGRVRYAVRPWLVTVLAVAAGGAVALAADRSLGQGRLLFAIAAVAAGGEAARSLVLRPTLAADAAGVMVATGLRRQWFTWAEVEAVRTLRPPSGGGRARRSANALELDLGDRLVVVPAYRLGAPPDEVVATLTALASGAPSDPA